MWHERNGTRIHLPRRSCAFAFIAFSLPALLAPAADIPYKVPIGEQGSHRQSGRDYIRSERFGNSEDSMEVNVVVDRQGNVESVHALNGHSELFPKVEALEKQSKYQPFLLNGKPVRAVIHEVISIVPPERWSPQHQQFPLVQNWTSVRAKLVRRSCEPCFSYSVEVRGNGQVLFNGSSSAMTPGRHYGWIGPESVKELLAEFRRSDYFSLQSTYVAPITDSQGALTSIEFDGRRKAVDDYVGILVGAPDVLELLEKRFDQIAGTDKWVKGNDHTVRALQAEHWNLEARNDNNEWLFRNAFERGPGELVDYLLDQPHLPQSILSCGLESEAGRGDLARARHLLRMGANPNDSPCGTNGTTVLMRAVESDRADVVREVLGRHPDVNTKDRQGEAALALYLRRTSLRQHDGAILSLLLSAGADPNARGWTGETPLFAACFQPIGIIQTLLKAGVDLNARDRDGRTPIMACDDERGMQALVDLGAEVQTAIEYARKHQQSEKAAFLRRASARRNHKAISRL